MNFGFGNLSLNFYTRVLWNFGFYDDADFIFELFCSMPGLLFKWQSVVVQASSFHFRLTRTFESNILFEWDVYAHLLNQSYAQILMTCILPLSCSKSVEYITRFVFRSVRSITRKKSSGWFRVGMRKPGAISVLHTTEYCVFCAFVYFHLVSYETVVIVD